MYKTKGVKAYPFNMSKSNKLRSGKNLQSAYNKAMKDLRETKATAHKYGIVIQNVQERPLSSMNRLEATRYINSVNTFNKKNTFIVNNGRVNNQFVIDQYNKAVNKNNSARQSIRSNLMGKSKLSGGKVITQNGKRQTIKSIDIKSNAGELNTKLSEYNYKRDLTDTQIEAKTKIMNKTTREFKGEKESSLFKKNFMKGMNQQLKDGVLTQEQYDEIKADVKKLSTGELLEWYYREEYSQIGFTYSLDELSQATQQQASNGLVYSLTGYTKRVTRT